jgi:hypothetical protein
MREGQDVKFLYFSRQEDLLAALNQGIVPAEVRTCPTDIMAQRLGFKELVDISLSNFSILTIPSPPAGPYLSRILICFEVF